MFETVARFAPRGFPWDAQLGMDVASAYGSPGRHYHTALHIVEVAASFGEVAQGPGWRDPHEVFLAVLAHDAVYDPARTDNEARSAGIGRAWAERLGIGASKVEVLILATASHTSPAASADPDLGSFLDCDLAILGAEPDRNDAYARRVAAEYTAVVPAAWFRAGRARFLAQMLSADHVFHTPFFRERYEERARANLVREQAALAREG